MNPEDTYEVKTKCIFCDTTFEALFEIDGQCPGCDEKYTWQSDCDYEGAVLVVEWNNYSMFKPIVKKVPRKL